MVWRLSTGSRAIDTLGGVRFDCYKCVVQYRESTAQQLPRGLSSSCVGSVGPFPKLRQEFAQA
eukprot:12681790-Alexandrium_andersonii.AAC.1